ncbi:MAG: hypothetical protein RL291_656 [Pseudomonadota bacterium]
MTAALDVVALRAIDAVFDDMVVPLERERAEEIAAHWAELQAKNPHLWNGRVLVQHAWEIVGGVYRARYAAINFATMLAWRDKGFPGPPMRNGFAAAALRARDGAFLMGLMAETTANAGRWHFPAGTPDLQDVTADGRVDLAASLVRELREETGLEATEVVIDPRWYAVEAGPRVAFLRIVDLPLDADAARALILSRLPSLAEQELADIVIVRTRADVDRQRSPPFFAAFLDAALEGRLPQAAR